MSRRKDWYLAQRFDVSYRFQAGDIHYGMRIILEYDSTAVRKQINSYSTFHMPWQPVFEKAYQKLESGPT
jgi:hypothetical protein